jgi:dolichol-phosphate mannosyltransferase
VVHYCLNAMQGRALYTGTSSGRAAPASLSRASANSSRRRIHIVLPAYNEAPRLGILLERIDEAMREGGLPYDVILVDDGSSDGTARVAEEWAGRIAMVVETHPRNLGLGPTIRDGLVIAARVAERGDVVVTMDADDTHAPGLIVRMMQRLAEGFDVVIASRYEPGARIVGLTRWRRLLSWGAAFVFRALLPTPGVRDFTCGYRAYRAEVLKWGFATYGDRFVDQDGFQCMVDVLLKLRKGRFVFGEVPLVLRYDRKAGASKMKVARTVRDTLLLLIRNRLAANTVS